MELQPMRWEFSPHANTLTVLFHETPPAPRTDEEPFGPTCGYRMTMPVAAVVFESYPVDPEEILS
jgi:hypothetical protein